MGYVREYRDGDAESVAPRLRERDRQEIAANTGREPVTALLHCVASSQILCTIVGSDERPAGLFGVSPVTEVSGCVWLLGTDDLVRPPLRKQFLVEGRAWLNQLHAFRPLLFNFVDVRNTVHVRWLRWMGFTFLKLHPEYGVERRPFWEFVRLHHV